LISGSLQRAGLIEYWRGRVKILDRENLESAACDSYKVVKDLFANLYSRDLLATGERASEHEKFCPRSIVDTAVEISQHLTE
jgi:hypothetical protein